MRINTVLAKKEVKRACCSTSLTEPSKYVKYKSITHYKAWSRFDRSIPTGFILLSKEEKGRKTHFLGCVHNFFD